LKSAAANHERRSLLLLRKKGSISLAKNGKFSDFFKHFIHRLPAGVGPAWCHHKYAIFHRREKRSI
jgi:hypothetical protein